MRVEPSGPTPSIRLVIGRPLQFRFACCGTSGGNAAARRPPAAGRLPQCSARPTPKATVASMPAGPASPSGLSIGSSFNGPGVTAPANWTRAAAATLAITTTRQRRERNRPQASPAIAYSQPIGLAGRRSVRTSPTVASRARTTAMFAVPDETVGDESTSRASGEQPGQQAAGRLGQLQGGQRGGQVA
jgi:hypothetical protein